MAYPVGTPYLGSSASPAYAGRFIPEVWSGKLIVKFYDATVLAAIANTDYEGEISNYGDTVHIRQVPSITINDYAADQALAVQRPSADIVDLLIDQGKYFNAVLDDVFKVQSDLDMMGMWAEDASEQMKISIDTDILGGIGATVAAANAGATAGAISGDINLGVALTPVAITPANVLDYIVDCGTVLDEQNVPETGRWMVIPTWMAGRIKKSDLKDASIAGDNTSILRNGRIGMIDRFTLYSSNNLNETTGTFETLFGHSVGLTFASQLTNMETLRSENTFGDLLRGLQVYGWKTTKPEALGLGFVDKS